MMKINCRKFICKPSLRRISRYEIHSCDAGQMSLSGLLPPNCSDNQLVRGAHNNPNSTAGRKVSQAVSIRRVEHNNNALT